MTTHATSHTQAAPHHARVPLSWLFFALLALTAAEVLLYEVWHYTGVHYPQPFVPKYVIVLLILLFTLPKAAIVMIYFMHLKFERQLIVALAIIPFFFAMLGVLTPLSDTLTLKPQADNRVLTPDTDTDHAGHTDQAGHGDADHGQNHMAEPEPRPASAAGEQDQAPDTTTPEH